MAPRRAGATTWQAADHRVPGHDHAFGLGSMGTLRVCSACASSVGSRTLVARASWRGGLPAEARRFGGRRVVEPRGIEPLTSSLRTRRSPS